MGKEADSRWVNQQAFQVLDNLPSYVFCFTDQQVCVFGGLHNHPGAQRKGCKLGGEPTSLVVHIAGTRCVARTSVYQVISMHNPHRYAQYIAVMDGA
eukprot:1161225-Pelagomonas_calceolata.AAC.16